MTPVGRTIHQQQLLCVRQMWRQLPVYSHIHAQQWSVPARSVHHRRIHTRPPVLLNHRYLSTIIHHNPATVQSPPPSQPLPQDNDRHDNSNNHQQATADSTASSPSYLPHSRALRYLIYITATGLIIYTVPPLHYAFTTAQRFTRTLYTMAAIAVDYKYFFYTHTDEAADDYNPLLNVVHSRSATRILNLCMLNKGLYIKTGQYMASMNHVLPPEYITTLRVLQDQAPSIPFSTVQDVICADLNITSLADAFTYFHRTPLAAASLAQVHYAITKDGREVAVKVQYPQLRTDFVVDMFANYLILTLGGQLFYNFNLEWLHDELRGNLVKELDFRVEGQNADRCRQQLLDGNVRNVRVPTVHWDLSGVRVLALEYIHGFKINDVQQQERVGVDTKSAVSLAIKSLSEQIFLHGFVHCDPHPGNIFVRPLIEYKHPIAAQAQAELCAAQAAGDVNAELPGTKQMTASIAADTTQTTVQYNTSLTQHLLSSTPFEIILLDHGLYREVSEHVRLTYCKLWEALILHDDTRVIKYCAELGVHTHWKWFATGVLMRPYNLPIKSNAGRVSKEQIKRMRQQAQKQIPAILQMSKDMPRELLLVMRNQNYLRSLNAELGAPVNRFRIMARAAVRGIYYRRPEGSVYAEHVEVEKMKYPVVTRKSRKTSSLLSISAIYHRVRFELYLGFYDLLNKLGVLYLKVFQPELMKQAELPADDPNALPITG